MPLQVSQFSENASVVGGIEARAGICATPGLLNPHACIKKKSKDSSIFFFV